MKITTPTIWVGLGVFVWCLFMGVTAISIGVGALYPPANFIAKPFVCPTGKMSYEQIETRPLPDTTYTATTWYCGDSRTGEKTELDLFPMSLYAGIIYGVLLFLLLVVIWVLVQRRVLTSQDSPNARRRKPAGRQQRPNRPPLATAPPENNALARMKELTKLRAADMISEDEYQQKRAEILKDL